MNYKKSIHCLLCLIILCAGLVYPCIAGEYEHVSAKIMYGEWTREDMLFRDAIVANRTDCVSTVDIHVSHEGDYQLCAYVYHAWHTFFPCIYVEATDAEGKKHYGYHKIENIWYLGEEHSGRWFFVSLSQNPYWYLPAGNLHIRFWAQGEKDAWQGMKTSFEGALAVSDFFLLPVFKTEERMTLPWVANPEVMKGNWKKIEYDKLYGTNYVKTDMQEATLTFTFVTPVSGYYRGVFSTLSPEPTMLDIAFDNKDKKQTISLLLDGSEQWCIANTKGVYLSAGKHMITITNEENRVVRIDYIIFVPISS